MQIISLKHALDWTKNLYVSKRCTQESSQWIDSSRSRKAPRATLCASPVCLTDLPRTRQRNMLPSLITSITNVCPIYECDAFFPSFLAANEALVNRILLSSLVSACFIAGCCLLLKLRLKRRSSFIKTILIEGKHAITDCLFIYLLFEGLTCTTLSENHFTVALKRQESFQDCFSRIPVRSYRTHFICSDSMGNGID